MNPEPLMEKNLLTVNILGSTFTIKSDNNPDYLGEVVAYLKGKIDEVRQGTAAGNDPLKIALLASLNLVDELFKAKQHTNPGKDRESKEIEHLTEQLINKIDESLMEN
ncbi:hypothetical protein ES703_33916 [subsurface metagenome]